MEKMLKSYQKTVSIISEKPVELYENLSGGKIGFLLESYDREYDRFTLMGTEPQALVSSEGQSLVVRWKDGRMERWEGNPKDLLKDFYNSFHIDIEEKEPGFYGGLVGSLGYDFIRCVEKLPDNNPDEIGIDTIQMMFVTSFLVVDYREETMTAIVLGPDTPEGEKESLREAKELLDTAMGREIAKGKDGADGRAAGAADGNAAAGDPSQAGTAGNAAAGNCAEAGPAGTADAKADEPYRADGHIVSQTDTEEQYAKKVEKIKHYIHEGDVFQTVLSQRWTVETGHDGLTLYKQLRELNPSPYLYYFNFGTFEIIGSSPEMLVKRQREKVFTCPIAGTRPRGKTPEEDKALETSLLADEKERAEHAMLVDLARNDMGRIAQFGSVKVTDFMEIRRYSHVMHICSTVEGRMKGTNHPLSLLESFLPAGTLSGAPKIRAMEIIDELEEVRRGVYGGAIGYLDFSGNLDFCIAIRTMVKKGRKVYLQAGAGIVADSVPEREYQECRNKVMALAKAVVREEEL